MFSRDLPNGQTFASADFLRGKDVETAGWRVLSSRSPAMSDQKDQKAVSHCLTAILQMAQT